MLNYLTECNKPRTLLILGIGTYVACFQWMYINWLNPDFGYYGFDLNTPAIGYLVLAWVLSVLPTLWMPLVLTRPSQLIYWVLYSIVYIPCMFVPLYAGLSKPSEIAWLMLTLFAGLKIIGTGYSFPLRRFRPPHLTKSHFWFGLGLMACVFTLWVIVAFRRQFQISALSDVYDVRLAANDVTNGTLLNYPLMWLYGAINPFLMGWGLYHKRAVLFLAGALGQLVIYGCLGTKASILSIIFVAGFHLLLRGSRLPFGVKLTWSLAGLVGGLCLSFVHAGGEPDVLQWTMLFVVIMRLLSLNALATAQLYGFLQNHPYTYFSHVKLLNWFIQYPYGNVSVGGAVGDYYYGDFQMDQTTHFWATDGLASFGLPGILMISVFCAFVFWLLDSLAERHDPRLAALLVSYAAYNLANVGIFTTLLSGGLGLLMVILYLMPREKCAISVRPIVSAAAVKRAT